MRTPQKVNAIRNSSKQLLIREEDRGRPLLQVEGRLDRTIKCAGQHAGTSDHPR